MAANLCMVLFVVCRPQPGVREWLDTLGRFNVPCALVSALDRQTVQVRVHPERHTRGCCCALDWLAVALADLETDCLLA